MSIPDNASMTDTIIIAGVPGNLTDVKVFLDIQHQKTSDLTIKLKAPNSTEIILSAANGGTSANGYLTVFDDSAAYGVTSSAYLAPWSNYVKPQNPMTTFGGTALNGNWVLTITDGAATNTGTLLGWGLRFNGSFLVGTQNISEVVPQKFNLHQNYPNPFNPVTKIKFEIKDTRFVTLKVYDILGREVATLVNEKFNAGTYETQFSINSITGNQKASGVYFYRMEAGDFKDVKKMILIK
jgi:subtilisin-like proprotein convertase family protein